MTGVALGADGVEATAVITGRDAVALFAAALDAVVEVTVAVAVVEAFVPPQPLSPAMTISQVTTKPLLARK
jgi:hypothetical protein